MYMSETKKKLFNEQKISRNVSVRVSEMSVQPYSIPVYFSPKIREVRIDQGTFICNWSRVQIDSHLHNKMQAQAPYLFPHLIYHSQPLRKFRGMVQCRTAIYTGSGPKEGDIWMGIGIERIKRGRQLPSPYTPSPCPGFVPGFVPAL